MLGYIQSVVSKIPYKHIMFVLLVGCKLRCLLCRVSLKVMFMNLVFTSCITCLRIIITSPAGLWQQENLR